MNMFESEKAYLKCVRDKLNMFYSYGDVDSGAKQALKEQIKGFTEAGMVIGIITYDEFGKLADEIHLDIFGKTIEERRVDKKLGNNDILKWSKYEEPSYIRKKKSQKK